MPATPVHHTATDDGEWDGPAQEKKLETPLTKAIGDDTFAWVDPDGDETTKSAWKFIHHFVSKDGLPGSASTLACSTGIGVLNGARKGTTIPAADREGVWKHLAAHLTDAGVKEEDVPELKSREDLLEELAATDNKCNRCNGEGTISLNDQDLECPQCGGSGEGDANADGQANAAPKIPATAIRAELRGVPESRVSTGPKFELREIANGTGGTNLRFTGFASVTDAEYEMEDWQGPWVESVGIGAFGKTLNEGADVAFLLNHEGMTLARTKPGTLKLSEETDGASSPVYGVTGLHSEALLDPENMYVQAMRSAVERGDLDEMSFAFRVTRQEWNPEFDRRWINEVSLDKGDVSLVNYGANPTTGGTVAMRQRLIGRASEQMPVERIVALFRKSALFRELREGKVLSAANSDQLQQALEALHTADDVDIPAIVRSLQDIDAAVDAGLAGVSNVLDVANPDGDPADLEPALAPPQGSLALPNYGAEARARLAALSTGPRRGVA